MAKGIVKVVVDVPIEVFQSKDGDWVVKSDVLKVEKSSEDLEDAASEFKKSIVDAVDAKIKSGNFLGV